ncbi:MAG TPA: anthranilate synthase component I family protein, partial [bacterium]|nr:anthranilate synthase component I family protein [bacterium]
MSNAINIRSIKTFKLEKVPDLTQLSYLTGLKKDRALFFSSGLHPVHGRYSVLTLNPLFLIDESFDDLIRTLFSYRAFSSFSNIPLPLFSGWMNYECLRFIEKVGTPAKNTIEVPDFHFVFSDSFIVVDNFEKRAELVLLETDYSTASIDERKRQFFQELAITIPDIEKKFGSVKANALISKKRYVEAISEIRRRISEGEVYQVNFTYPVEIKTEIPSWVLFYKYLSKNHADYAAFINSEKVEVLSISPECFFRIENGEKVSSYPIKGTIKKGKNIKENEELQNELQNSAKDHAELAMIVDLIRNDIGKIALPGTVKVEKHAELFEFPTLFHLVSTVSGTIEKNRSIDLFKSLFPGGSITGAPKISAMKIISHLEEYKRNIYTGAIGFSGLNGNAVFNIPIRTVQRVGDTLIYSTGGGITFKSDPEKEFEETLIKTKAFLNIFDDAEIVFE